MAGKTGDMTGTKKTETRHVRTTLLRFSFFPPVFFPGSLSETMARGRDLAVVREMKTVPVVAGGHRPPHDVAPLTLLPKSTPPPSSKPLRNFLLLFLAALLFSVPITSRAAGVTGPEAREMAGLAQSIQAYLDRNGHAPDNWSGIWNEDQLLKAKARHPELAPLYDRYSFVANRYPIFAKSGDDAIDGTIVLMHNEVVGLDNGTGSEWWFVYITPDNRARVGSLSEGQLSSGNGVGRFRLLAPDVSQETVAAFERKLVILGYTSPHKSPGAAAPTLDLKYASPPR